MLSFNFAPKNWAMCNGQLLTVSQNQALFSLLGTVYGGNGTTTFGLPDLQGRVPFHVAGSMPLGQVGGEETHTLASSEMPIHTHTVTAVAGPANASSPVGNYWAESQTAAYDPSFSSTMAPGSVALNGGSGAHENRPPFLVLNFCIALTGLFPTRS